MMNFERLEVWRLSIDFATLVYKLTGKYPKSELYGLTSQLRRASTSISLNIAEGSGRTSNQEFCRFLDIAIGSTLECVSALHISLQLNFISSEDYKIHRQKADTVCIKLRALKNYLKKAQKPSTMNYQL